ncbi:MAG: PAS domain S-box protein [Acidobacteria bacterium]|nr:PAS domain S-box protein [Acidobacteriota bacterium]
MAEHHPDILLLDVSMPQMDGLAALPEVIAASPETRVIMLSGFEGQGLAEHAKALGAADFIEKAFPIEELPERLRVGAEPPAPAGIITGPSEAETEVLARHLERFRAVFDEATAGMATLTLAGRLVRANQSLAAMTDHTPQTLIGTTFLDLVSPADREVAEAVLRSIDIDPERSRELEHRIGARGTTWVRSTLTVVKDPDRNPLYLFLQVEDITERRAAEEALRQSEERFRLLVAGVGDYAIFMLDPNGMVSSWNLGAERIKGYAAEEIIGRHFSTFYPPEAIAIDHPQHELEVAQREGRFEEEGWRVRKDGSQFWANVVITALRDGNGTLIGYAKVTRDITERRRLQDELEKAANDRSEFLAVAAHELRSPAAIVKGFASTLRATWSRLEESDRLEMLDAIARGGERMGRLVDDLFTAARLERGVLEINPVAVAVEVALHDAVDQRRFGEDGSTMVIDCPPGLTMMVDPIRFQQMLGNYLDNAERYGEPPIVVAATESDGEVLITVRDQGPGLEAAFAERLFTKFGKGPHANGSGLGLFLVRELARAQGGDASLETTESPGTCFLLRLPAATPAR